MKATKSKALKIVWGAMFLAIALVLPFLTGQIQQFGNALCPMHLPVFLCGFFCGPLYGAAVGLIAPILRFMIFGMPPILPTGLSMGFELMTYGFVSGLLYKKLPQKKGYVYVALISAMVAGRIVWGIVNTVLLGLGKFDFSWNAFVAGAFLNAIPGIIIQIVIIPILVIVIRKNTDV